jgi:ribosome maturation protein Sdo1
VIGALRDQEVRGDEAVRAVADLADLTVEQVRIAIRYTADHIDEIDERIRQNQELADESEQRWRREQHVIA